MNVLIVNQPQGESSRYVFLNAVESNIMVKPCPLICFIIGISLVIHIFVIQGLKYDEEEEEEEENKDNYIKLV